MQGAWKVGLLVILFVALIFGAYALFGQNLFAQKTDQYYADFKDAQGVSVGTPVLMAGVSIGKVQRVNLANPFTARLTLAIDRKYKIPLNSVAQIQSSLVGLGQQPLVIVPPAAPALVMMEPNSVIHGQNPSPIEAYLPGAKATLAQLDKTLRAAQELLQDQRLKGGIENLIATSTRTVAQFSLVAERANGVIGQNQGMINRAVQSAAVAMEDIQKSTAELARFAENPKWRTQTLALIDSLNDTSKRASDLVANLNSIVTNPKLLAPIGETAENAATISRTGTRIAANTEVMSKNGIVMTQKAIEIEDKAKTLEDKAGGVLDRIQNVFGFKKSSPNILAGVSGSLDFIRESDPGHTRTDLNFTVPLKDDILHLGLFDAFETNKVNAELGRRFGNGSEYMYGIYASKPALGVDFRLAPRLFLRGDLYNINTPRLDLRARIELGGGFYGWIGLNQVFKQTAPLIGIGFRR